MNKAGRTPEGLPRFGCESCRRRSVPGSTENDEDRLCPRLVRVEGRWRVVNSTEGFTVTREVDGRARVQLGKDHPFANTGGWQWLARFLVADALGALPRPDEHAHHLDGDKTRDELENLALVSVEFHGSVHAWAYEVAGRRDPRTGR